jgi:hypothetical protein
MQSTRCPSFPQDAGFCHNVYIQSGADFLDCPGVDLHWHSDAFLSLSESTGVLFTRDALLKCPIHLKASPHTSYREVLVQMVSPTASAAKRPTRRVALHTSLWQSFVFAIQLWNYFLEWFSGF